MTEEYTEPGQQFKGIGHWYSEAARYEHQEREDPSTTECKPDDQGKTDPHEE